MKKTVRVLATASLVVGLVAAVAVAGTDFGVDRDNLLRARSVQLFGVLGPVAASSTSSVTADQANADPTSLATFAKSLSARVVTSGVAAPVIDMLALWPNDQDPTWLIACNEQFAADPGLQRINIATGAVQTIVSGTIFCDAAKRTPWGTIVFTEENGGGATGGRVYELIDPLNTTSVTLDRTTGTFTGAREPRTSRSVPRWAGCPSRASASTRTASCTTATRTAR